MTGLLQHYAGHVYGVERFVVSLFDPDLHVLVAQLELAAAIEVSLDHVGGLDDSLSRRRVPGFEAPTLPISVDSEDVVHLILEAHLHVFTVPYEAALCRTGEIATDYFVNVVKYAVLQSRQVDIGVDVKEYTQVINVVSYQIVVFCKVLLSDRANDSPAWNKCGVL